MIEVRNLDHYYGRFHALKNINFTIPSKGITGLIGQNGAGKSTLLKILAGYLIPAGGEVCIDGLLFTENPMVVRQKIGYMPETPLLYKDMKVTEYLDYVGRLKGLSGKALRTEIDTLITKCGLQKVYHKLVGNLSKGNRQRAAMAQALMGSPSVLLLDEPTSAMDPAQVLEIREFIRSLTQNALVLMSTHVLSEITQVCDYIVCIRSGEIQYEGSMANLYGRQSTAASEFKIRLADFKPEWLTHFQNLPGAKLQKNDQRELCFSIENGDTFFPSLIQLAAERKFPLREMLWGTSQLESLFKEGATGS
jgi:ABC-2 type transport system ATP-binding protein